MRTTSSIESLNSQMNRSFPKRGHIWKFIEQLKFHEYSKARDMHRISKDTNFEPKRKRKSDRERDEKIKFLSNLLRKKEITANEFLEAMAGKHIFPKNDNTTKFSILQNQFR